MGGEGPGNDLQQEREALRRGLRRANMASVLILVLLVALAFGFVWNARESAQEAERANGHASRARAEAERARQATARAEDELWNSRLNEARARRMVSGPGARMEAAAIVRELVRRPHLNEEQIQALRREAIAQLALVDVVAGTNELGRTNFLAWEGSMTRYAQHNAAREVEVREFPSGRLVATFRGASNAVPHQSVFTADGHYLATRFHGGDVLVWEVASKDLFLKSRCQRLANDAHPLMPTRDGRALAMFTASGLMVLPLEADAVARPLQGGRIVYNAVFTPDGKQLAVVVKDRESVVELWDARTGATVETFEVGFRTWTVEWHPDGRRLAISGDRGRLGIWDTSGREAPGGNVAAETSGAREILRLEGHTGAVDYTGFAPDGAYLLTHSYDKTSILWDVTSGQRLFAETRIMLEGFSRDGGRMRGVQEASESITELRRRTGFQTIAWIDKPQQVNGIWLSPDMRLLAIAHPASSASPRGNAGSGI